MTHSDYELSQNKLIILYMLEMSENPLTNTQISDFVLEHGYTNYFSLQEYLNQLTDTELIKIEEVGHNSFYHLTKKGKTILEFFVNRIPDVTKEEVETYLKEHQLEIRTNVEIVANYIPGLNDDYKVHCYVKDGPTMLMEITLTVFDKETAVSMCKKWKTESSDIYKTFLYKLMD